MNQRTQANSDMLKPAYRSEVDGLRALAIVSVLFYHAQFIFFGNDWFKGGYIGVDIFFVISGYLITRIILHEQYLHGSFSLLNFYERRVRRIIPVLVVVALGAFVYAFYSVRPSQFIELSESILASLYFVSNFFFYFNTTEYGAESSLLKPFLHTWSLGVEEQFYLVFPVLMIAIFRFLKSHFLAIIILLSLLSLLFAEIMEVRNSDLNFYLPFSRFWELAVGSILAYRELNAGSGRAGSRWTQLMPIAGLLMIAYAIFFFDKKTPHPGVFTIIPVVGVALVIGFSNSKCFVGRLLSYKPVVWIGLTSYSAYLWHFPIFAFSRISAENHSNSDKFAWIALAYVFSILSFWLVEKPFRNKKFVGTKVFFSIIILLYITFSVALIAIVSNKTMHETISRYNVDYAIDRGGFVASIREIRKALGRHDFVDDRTNVLVVGNSLAQDVARVLHYSEYSNEYDFLAVNSYLETGRRMYQIDCFYRYIAQKGQNNCNKFDFNIDRLFPRADIIVFSQRYNRNHIRQMDELIPLLKDAGKQVVIVSSKYAQKPNMLVDFIRDNKRYPDEQETVLLEEQLFKHVDAHARADLNTKLRELASRHSIQFLNDQDLYCDSGSSRCSVFARNGFMLTFDDVHLTDSGAHYLAGNAFVQDWFDLSR